MSCYSRSGLTDQILLSNLFTHLSEDRATTATLLADLAAVEDRKLYVPAAYPSMHLYCVRELQMSEETAYKRMRAARAAREYPALYPALAEGRLHLTAVVLLSLRLTPENEGELIAAATHKTKAEIELLLAERFPRPVVPTIVRATGPASAADEPAVGLLERPELGLSPGTVVPSIEPKRGDSMGPLPPNAKLAPLSAGWFEWHLTVDKETQEQLRYAQALLGHALPSGDVPAVLKRALGALVRELEKRKFAKCARTRPNRSAGWVASDTPRSRYVSAEIRSAVWERDGGQCTFASDAGKRCESRTRLEFDHLDALARGGATTVGGLRLRCRAHNQFTAECTFGSDFMRGKREEARCRAEKAKADARRKKAAQTEADARAKAEAKVKAEAAAERARELDVTPWLRQLGFTVREALRGVELCAHIPDASLEDRLRVALQGLAPRSARRVMYVSSSASAAAVQPAGRAEEGRFPAQASY